MILSDSSWRYINLALYPRLAADTVVDIKTEHSKIAYLCNKWLRRRHAIAYVIHLVHLEYTTYNMPAQSCKWYENKAISMQLSREQRISLLEGTVCRNNMKMLNADVSDVVST